MTGPSTSPSRVRADPSAGKVLDAVTSFLDDFEKLVSAAAATEFRLQDTQAQVETLTWQLAAAKAARAMGIANIGGEFTDRGRLTRSRSERAAHLLDRRIGHCHAERHRPDLGAGRGGFGAAPTGLDALARRGCRAGRPQGRQEREVDRPAGDVVDDVGLSPIRRPQMRELDHGRAWSGDDSGVVVAALGEGEGAGEEDDGGDRWQPSLAGRSVRWVRCAMRRSMAARAPASAVTGAARRRRAVATWSSKSVGAVGVLMVRSPLAARPGPAQQRRRCPAARPAPRRCGPRSARRSSAARWRPGALIGSVARASASSSAPSSVLRSAGGRGVRRSVRRRRCGSRQRFTPHVRK